MEKCPKKGVTFNREEYFQLIRILSGIDPMLIDCGKAFAKESAEQQREQAAAAGDQISSYQDEVRGALETAEEDDYVELDKTEPEEDASSSARFLNVLQTNDHNTQAGLFFYAGFLCSLIAEFCFGHDDGD